MKKLAIMMVAILCSAQAWATTYHAGNDCAALKPYVPPADIDAQAGHDAAGNVMVPADISPPAMDIEALKKPTIGLDLPIYGFIDGSAYNADLSRADVNVGQIHVDQNSEFHHNDKLLSTSPEAVYPPDCK